MRFWLGGYTADMDGSARGIGTMLAGAQDAASTGGALTFAGDAAAAPSPSWLAQHPTLDVVYAALEGIGKVAAFARSGEATFVRLGPAVEAGAAACHIAVAPDGGSLVASCYGDGRVVRMALDADGAPSAPVIAAAAADPLAAASRDPEPDGPALLRAFREALGEGDAEGEAGVPIIEPDPGGRVSRAHASAFLPDGRVATTDLGFDLVRIWRPSARGLIADHEVVLPPGSGPRHLVLHPSGHLHVITEYSCEVFTLGPDRTGRWALLAGVTASPFGAVGTDFGAEIALSHDAAFLYGGMRGSNTISTLRVRGDGGSLEPVALVEAGVDWPRHHIVQRDILLVAGQRSSDVASLTIDTRTGVPGRVRHRAEAPSPTCLLPVR